MSKKLALRLSLVAAAVVLPLLAQEPTCKKCSATYIGKDELQSYLNRAPANLVVADQQVRATDIGKAHVDVGVVYRGKLTAASTASPAAEHDLVSEVYHVIDGSGTLVTGWDVVDMQRRPADNESVKMLNGPGSNGTSIRNGQTYRLKAGDVVIIPAGVGHWFTRIDDHISYLMVRIDPDKVTPLKDEAASGADLKSGFKAQ